MNIISLSGGSGRRLQPLSNDVCSKQFIKIFRDEEGGYGSMIQHVYRQIERMDAKAIVTIVTPGSQVPTVRNQLEGSAGISAEPCRRSTSPVIAPAASCLHNVQGVGGEETVVVCPVGPYADDSHFEALKQLTDQAQKGEANLVLMGAEPTYLSEKYGYTIPMDGDQASTISTLKEKPDVEAAEEYIIQGALWSSDVFTYKLSYVLKTTYERTDFINYDDLFSKYDTLDKISFDYAIVEKEDKIQVQRFAG